MTLVFENFQKRGVARVTRPPKFLHVICQHCSIVVVTVCRYGLQVEVHVHKNCPNMTPYKITEMGECPELRDALNFTWRIYALSERLVVNLQRTETVSEKRLSVMLNSTE